MDINIDLPASSVEKSQRPEQPLFLTVRHDLSLVLGENPVTRGELKQILDALTEGDNELRIFLRADKTVDYGDLMQVMNALRDAGYLKVALVGVQESMDGQQR